MRTAAGRAAGWGALALVVGLTGCRDLDRFASRRDHFEGTIVAGTLVRSGFPEGMKLCLVFDPDKLQEGPGSIESSDGLFHAAALRPIQAMWHDPMSLLSFGDGRVRNAVYSVQTSEATPRDVLAVVSLMESGDIEVRLVRGAGLEGDLFGVYSLSRAPSDCPFGGLAPLGR